jgi:hypothetical protein
MTTPTPPATPPAAPPPPAPKAPEKSRYSDPDTVLEFACESLWEGILLMRAGYAAAAPKPGKDPKTIRMSAPDLTALATAVNRLAEISGAKAPVTSEVKMLVGDITPEHARAVIKEAMGGNVLAPERDELIPAEE